MRIRFQKSVALLVGATLGCSVGSLSAQQPSTYGPIDAGQTLWSLAGNLADRYPTMTQHEVAAALKIANPRAFVDGTRHLRAGSSLILPSPGAARTLAQNSDLPASQRSRPPGAAPTPESGPAEPPDTDTSKTVRGPTTETAATSPPAPPTTADARAKPAVADVTPREAAAIKQAQTLTAAGDAEQAYTTLLPLLGQLGGVPSYDYAFGTAALDAGDFGQAVLALERVVYADPNFAGARLDLARAYLATGDNDSALRELRRVRQSNPPPAIASVVADLIRTAERDQAISTKPWSVRVFASAGFDGNANASTSDDNFFGFQLDPRNRETESSFVGAGGAARLRLGLGEGLGFSTGASATYRHFPDAEFVDATLVRADIGLARYWKQVTASLTALLHYGLLDDTYNNQGLAAEGALGYRHKSVGLNLKLRGGTLRFRDALSTQDVDQQAAGLTGLWQISPSVGLSVTALAGEDEAKEDGSPYSRDLTGLRGALVWRATSRVSVSSSVGWLNADYPDPFFGLQREDDQYTATLGASIQNWLPARLELSPSVRFIDNDSTVTLFKYDRLEVGFTVSRQF